MSRKLRLLLIALPFLLIVATFVPRYGIDSIISIPVATGIVYGAYYLVRPAVRSAIEIGRRSGS